MKTRLIIIASALSQPGVAIFENEFGDRISAARGEYLFGGFAVEECHQQGYGYAGYAVLRDQVTGNQIIVEAGDIFCPEDYH